MIRKTLVGLVALIAVAGNALGAKQYSVEDFFRDPELAGWQLSPDGTKLMAIAPSPKNDGARNIFIMDTSNPTGTIQQLTNEDSHVINTGWFNNERVFYGVLEEGRDTAGLWAVNIDGSRFRELVKPAAAANRVFRYSLVIDLLRDDPDRCLVISNEKRLSYPDIYIFDIYNGGKKIYTSNPGNVTGYVLDHDKVVRVGSELDGTTLASRVLYRDDEDSDWVVIKEIEDPDATWSPVAFLKDNKTMLVVSNMDSDTMALYTYDTDTHEITEKIFNDPIYDLGGVMIHPKRNDFLGITMQRDKPSIEFFDPLYAQLQATIDASFPDTVNRITSINEDDTMAVITSFSDTEPAIWYKFDITNMKIEPLGQAYSWINRDDIVEQRPISFESRDGATIHGYLSMPKSFQNTPVPLIVVPHGGPWARDTWPSFWTWTQFLANRGFAVLYVNFRGSTGYGRTHLESAYRRPDISYNDVIDGVDWAVAQGFADPERLGVLGFSWGGTSTMASIVFNPGKFQFGVAMAGQYDLPDGILEWRIRTGNELATTLWKHRMGDPGDPETKDFLEKWSPINHIDKVDVPIFIYHGNKDINVDVKESRRLERELKRNGQRPIAVYKTNEAHGMSIEKNRIDTWTKIDKFLRPFKPKR